MLDGPRIFDLSPPGLRGAWLARLLHENGLGVRHHEGGALARDITWGALTGTAPCPNRPGVRFYGGLEAAQDIAAAPSFGWRHFRYLRRIFRQAVFLLVLRDPGDWIADRLTDARAVQLQAIARGCAVADLPAIWAAEYRGLIADARRFFADDPRYVELPFAGLSFATLRDALAPWYALRQPVPDPDADADAGPAPAAPAGPRPGPAVTPPPVSARDPAPILPVPMPQPWPAPVRITPPLRGHDARFADAMAAFCLGAWVPGGAGGLGGVSELYGAFDGQRQVLGRDGRPLPVMRHPDLPGRPFIRPGGGGGGDKGGRLVGVLNEVRHLHRLQPLHIDMQDARFPGQGQGQGQGQGAGDLPGVALVSYNRRAGARNLTLWPLPGYHTPGAAAFAHPRSPDPVPWAAKLDRVVWRGDLSGQERLADGRLGHSAHRILSGLDHLAPDDEAGLAVIRARLGRVPRMAAMQALRGPDFDIGLVLSRYMRDFAPVLTGYLARPRPQHWFYRFRFILSLPGYDTGSNFIMAANSGSVVMKAEDGWQVYYSHLFRPWEHYIPLAEDASDAPARLDWARANPDACRAMVAAANAACARLADTRLRAAALHRVLDGQGARA